MHQPNPYRLLPSKLLFALCVGLPLASCVTDGHANRGSDPLTAKQAVGEESSKEEAEELEKKRDELAELEQDLVEADMDLRLEEMEAQADLLGARHSLEEARVDLKRSQAELATYREVEAPHLKSKVELSITQNEHRLTSARQDLAGILEIYEGEEEARAKQEIIRRNEVSVETATKRLEQSRTESRLMNDFEVPQAIGRKEWAVLDGEYKVSMAESKLQRVELKIEADQQKSVAGLQKTKGKIDRLRKSLDADSLRSGS